MRALLIVVPLCLRETLLKSIHLATKVGNSAKAALQQRAVNLPTQGEHLRVRQRLIGSFEKISSSREHLRHLSQSFALNRR